MASSSPGASSEDPFSSSSLFEGMVLFPPSEPTPPQPSPKAHQEEPSPHSQPLSEDLFSDLTILTPTHLPSPPIAPSPGEEPTFAAPAPSDVRNHGLAPRQASRKKKRGVRIGYAREEHAVSPVTTSLLRERDGFFSGEGGIDRHDADDASSVSTESSSMFSGASTEPSNSVNHVESVVLEPSTSRTTPAEEIESGELGVEPVAEIADGPVEEEIGLRREEQCGSPLDDDGSQKQEVEGVAKLAAASDDGVGDVGPIEGEDRGIGISEVVFDKSDDAFVLTEGNLELIRNQISQKLDEIREMAMGVYETRKKLERSRREVAESVNSAAIKHTDLEKELEEACEAEDFERAERVSEDLAAMEKEKDRLLSTLRAAEVECESVDLKMQQILQMQIKAEEEGAQLLEQFAKDAAFDANLIVKNVEELCSKEVEEWQESSEALEISRVEIDIKMQLIDEARLTMESSIEQLIQDDKKEKEKLCEKQDMLNKELEELLELVRLKKVEIEDNLTKIQDVEKKISNVANGFDETISSVSMKYDDLQSALTKVKAESDILSTKRKHIDENLAQAEHRRSKLIELSQISNDEAKKCYGLVALRKNLALPILKSQEDKMKHSTSEKKISEEIQILQRHISAARSSLQELSSNKSSIEEEIASLKQRVVFIDKRVPELEAEKKVAAAARNFKEAGRVAAEAKALSSEKEVVQLKIDEAVANLGKAEEEIQNILIKMKENEGSIGLKEKEAAKAGYQRLCLVAAAARAERFAALTLGDEEEAHVLLNEAEAAESKAKELVKSYSLNTQEIEELPEDQFSISLLINLSGKRLALMASSLGLLEEVNTEV